MLTLADFGEQLARVRGSRNLTKEAFARASGLSTATLSRAEASSDCTLRPATVLLMLEALSRAVPPLTYEEAVWFSKESGLDRNAALRYVMQPQTSSDAEAIRQGIDEIESMVGSVALRRAVDVFLECLKAAPAPSRSRTMVVKHPAVQKPGFIEERETEYEIPEAPPAQPRQRKPRQEPGF